MKYQILDTICLKRVVYDILAVDGKPPLFHPDQAGLPHVPWEGCARGYTAAYRLDNGRLKLKQAHVGYDTNNLRAQECTCEFAIRDGQRVPVVDDAAGTVSEGVASWYRLKRRMRFSGTIIIGVGDLVDDFDLGHLRLGSEFHSDCQELSFVDGVLKSKVQCARERAYQLLSPEKQLEQAVERAHTGDELMVNLMHHVLPRDWLESCKCPLSLRARGPISGQPMYEVLATLVDWRQAEDYFAHPFGLLLDELRRLREGLSNRPLPTGWSKYHQALHERYAGCRCLRKLEAALQPGAGWEIAKVGQCPHRVAGLCPVSCPIALRLEKLRRAGSKVHGDNLVRGELGTVPEGCACLAM